MSDNLKDLFDRIILSCTFMTWIVVADSKSQISLFADKNYVISNGHLELEVEDHMLVLASRKTSNLFSRTTPSKAEFESVKREFI